MNFLLQLSVHTDVRFCMDFTYIHVLRFSFNILLQAPYQMFGVLGDVALISKSACSYVQCR